MVQTKKQKIFVIGSKKKENVSSPVMSKTSTLVKEVPRDNKKLMFGIMAIVVVTIVVIGVVLLLLNKGPVAGEAIYFAEDPSMVITAGKAGFAIDSEKSDIKVGETSELPIYANLENGDGYVFEFIIMLTPGLEYVDLVTIDDQIQIIDVEKQVAEGTTILGVIGAILSPNSDNTGLMTFNDLYPNKIGEIAILKVKGLSAGDNSLSFSSFVMLDKDSSANYISETVPADFKVIAAEGGAAPRVCSDTTATNYNQEGECTYTTKVCTPNVKACSNEQLLKSCNTEGTFEAITDCSETGMVCKEGACVAKYVCGDGKAEGNDEECDGADLKESTCVSKGFKEGTLSCKADCKFDTNACVALEAPTTPPVEKYSYGLSCTEDSQCADNLDCISNKCGCTAAYNCAAQGEGFVCNAGSGVCEKPQPKSAFADAIAEIDVADATTGVKDGCLNLVEYTKLKANYKSQGSVKQKLSLLDYTKLKSLYKAGDASVKCKS
jgi:hypothetical protein